MRRFAILLVGLLLPGCSGNGAEGIPIPPPMDLTHIQRPSTPNTALAAPAGFSPEPDVVTPHYDVPAGELLAAIKTVALAQPRTYLHVAYDDRMQVHFVARSRFLNFPDLITAQINTDGTIVLWSRSVYGQSDFGVNRARLTAWMSALNAAVAHH